MWRELSNFSTNSLALILASTAYNAADYIRNTWNLNHFVMKGNTVYDCTMVELDKHHHEKGNITVVENGITVPFDVKRVYYLYDVPGGETRGGHAHKELYQLMVAASGSFSVILDDGTVKRTFVLNRPYQGLLIVPGIWRELDDFSSGSVCLVLASQVYEEADYIRKYPDFINYKHG